MVGRFDGSRSCCDTPTHPGYAAMGVIPFREHFDKSPTDRIEVESGTIPGDAVSIGTVFDDPDVDPSPGYPFPPDDTMDASYYLASPTHYTEWNDAATAMSPSSQFTLVLQRFNHFAAGYPASDLAANRNFYMAIPEIVAGAYDYHEPFGARRFSSYDPWGAVIGPFQSNAGDGLSPIERHTIDIKTLVDYYVAHHNDWLVSSTFRSFLFYLYPEDSWWMSAGDNERATYQCVDKTLFTLNNGVEFIP